MQRTIFAFLLILIPSLLFSQYTLEGKLYIYETDYNAQGANVIVVNTRTGAAADTAGRFRIDNIENNTIDVRISNIGCYPLNVTNVHFENHSIDLGMIPVFRGNFKMNVSVISERKYLFGLIKRPILECITEYIEDSPFPSTNELFIKCLNKPDDPIRFVLDTEHNEINIEFKDLYNCIIDRNQGRNRK